MQEKRRSITVYRAKGPDGETALTLSEFCDRCGCHPDIVNVFVRLGIVETMGGEGESMRFPASAAARLRRGLRLRRDLGISATSLPLVLDLLERIDELQAEIEELRKEI